MTPSHSEARKRHEDTRSDAELDREIAKLAWVDRDHGYHATLTMHNLLDEWERRHPEVEE